MVEQDCAPPLSIYAKADRETKYYYAGGSRIAVRVQGAPSQNGLFYLLGDHLGSTSITTNDSGSKIADLRYTAWGEVRDSSGTTPTNYTYTGQYSYTANFGLMFFNARWYDSSLGRFAQADTVIPGAGNVGAWDRYAAMLNNPMNLVDPSGHTPVPHPVPGCTRYDGDGYCVQGGFGNGWDTASLTHHGDTRTTSAGQQSTTDKGGAEVYDLFWSYKNTCGWWNNYMCGENSTFGLEEFLGLFIFIESGYTNPDAAHIIAVIIAQNLYNGGWNPAVCKDGGACFNAVLNFMGAYSKGSNGLFSGPEYASTLVTRERAGYYSNLISTLGYEGMNHGLVRQWTQNTGPSNWGDSKNWEKALRKAGIKENNVNETAIDTVYYYFGNGIYYLIFAQTDGISTQ